MKGGSTKKLRKDKINKPDVKEGTFKLNLEDRNIKTTAADEV